MRNERGSILLIVILLVIVIAAGYFLYKKALPRFMSLYPSNQAATQTTPAPGAGQTSLLQTEYQNPFASPSPTPYSNPFSTDTNPFSNLQ